MKNRLIVLLLAGTILSGCGGDDLPDPPADIRISGIELSETSKTLKIRESFTLKAEVKPANTTDDKTVSWTSSDASVATVNNGIITAIGLGEAVITAQAGTITATCKVTVIPIDVVGVILSETEKEIQAGDNFTLTATIEPANATDRNVVWSTSDKAIATVENGSVTGISVGEAVITAKSESGDFSATCKVKVLPIPVASISFKDESVAMAEGRTYQAVVIIEPDNATDKSVIYESLSPEILTVNENGLIIAKAPGAGLIKVHSSNGLSATIEVVVQSFTSELVTGMTFGSYSNPGGYITFSGSVTLSNYSAKRIYVESYFIENASGYIVTTGNIDKYIEVDEKLSIPVSISNVYRAAVSFVITDQGKTYIVKRQL